MDITNAVEAIQAILAPAVLISACGLLLLSMQNKYGRINDRIRALLRERLDLLAEPEKQFTAAQLEAIDWQLPDLLQRNRLQHDAGNPHLTPRRHAGSRRDHESQSSARDRYSGSGGQVIAYRPRTSTAKAP